MHGAGRVKFHKLETEHSITKDSLYSLQTHNLRSHIEDNWFPGGKWIWIANKLKKEKYDTTTSSLFS